MRRWAYRTSALAIMMVFAWCIAAAQDDYAAREKLRAHSNEFRKEVIRVSDGVYVADALMSTTIVGLAVQL